MIKFIIASTARTGSTLLQTLLNSHPSIKCYSEVFGAPNTAKKVKLANGTIVSAIDYPQIYLNNINWNNDVSKSYAVGFKIFYLHGLESKAEKNIWQILKEDSSVKIIHLTRENLLARYSSQHMANKTRVWSLTPKKSLSTFANFFYKRFYRFRGYSKIRLSFEDCKKDFIKQEFLQNKLRKEFENHKLIEITYEELTKDINSIVSTVLNFLELPNAKLKSEIIKQKKTSLKNDITNYSELKNLFKDSNWSHFFI